MVKQRMDLLELLRKRGMDGDVDLLREALRVLVDGIMDAEVSAQIGAQHGERSPERVTYRNGYRNRTWDTRVGTTELNINGVAHYWPSSSTTAITAASPTRTGRPWNWRPTIGATPRSRTPSETSSTVESQEVV